MKHVKKPNVAVQSDSQQCSPNSKIYYKIIIQCLCTLFRIQQQLKKKKGFIFLAQLDA